MDRISKFWRQITLMSEFRRLFRKVEREEV